MTDAILLPSSRQIEVVELDADGLTTRFRTERESTKSAPSTHVARELWKTSNARASRRGRSRTAASSLNQIEGW